MASEIDQLFSPQLLSSFREGLPPVQCMIWKGRDQYDTITLNRMYPFDTIDTIKRMICAKFSEDRSFVPRFTFVGIPMNAGAPTIETTYLPIDYLWYSNESHDPSHTHILAHPLKALAEGDERFVTSDGSFASPNYELRGRSTIEDILLRPYEGQPPVLHVFPLRTLLREYKGVTPLPQEDWNSRFAAYFPDVKMGGPYQATDADVEFTKKIQYFLSKRETTLDRLNQFLEDNEQVPSIQVTGVRQLRLIWKKPVDGFEGCASMFYQIPVTEKRPYMRLLPTEGSAITKLHVKGILPIPTLDDPRVLEIWGKEESSSPGMDMCMIKYVHRPSIGITQPIYGTIIVLNDATMNLKLLPPKNIRNLDPNLDFRNFRDIVEDVFDGLPQPASEFQLGEIAVTFSLTTSMKSKRFTRARLLQRLPYFQSFFYEIDSLPNEHPLLSLRYKAVSQYASEDKVFTLMTQYATRKGLDGDGIDPRQLIEMLQDEFEFTFEEAKEKFSEWSKNRSTFTLQLPEEGEFIESFNPGIDIHIHAQHPAYHFHVNRIDSQATYFRIHTLLSLLFMDDDDYYRNSRADQEMSAIEEELEHESMEREQVTRGKQEAVFDDKKYDDEEDEDNDDGSMYNDVFATVPTATASATASATATASSSSILHGMRGDTSSSVYQDPFAADLEPVKVASKKGPRIAPPVLLTKEQEEEQKLVDPTSWFIRKLQSIDKRLFEFKPTDDKNGYSRKCAGNEDRQPAVLTKDQYDRMREIYEEDPIVWIEYPLTGSSDTQESASRTEETITVMRFGSSTDTIRYYFCPRYFCLVDEIMIRPVEFEGTIARDGKRKSADSCPFCRGKLIVNDKKAIMGHTVVRRENKPKSNKYHKYIDFLAKTSHPEKFALPCCFTTQSTLRVSDEKFAHLRSHLQEERLDQVMEAPQEEYEDLVYRTDRAVEYSVLLHSIHKRYILESNKPPEAGIFATAPPSFDAFFSQHSGEQIVKRSPMLLKVRPNAHGFLRMGTDNTHYESLLGVIAPLINRNTIADVKDRIIEVMIPRIFLNAHFGNLVLEFYDPTDGRTMPSTQMELATWVQSKLGMTVTSNNRYALIRIYNAYHQFISFIKDPFRRKDLRHIQPLLAEPGLFTVRGIQLLIMDVHKTDPVRIKCPTFGVSVDRNRKNDVAFISRSVKESDTSHTPYTRYELFVYTSNKPAKGGEAEIHESILKWDYSSRRYWPDIVKKRVDEYMTQCESRYRTLYTSQQGVHSMAMVPLSKAIESTLYRPDGIIKDSYNHLVGVTFRVRAGGSAPLVALPVVDDGVVSISHTFSIKNIYLDWDEFKAAPVEDVIGYYQRELEPLFSLYPGYRVKNIARRGSDIVAIQLENGLYVPVAGPRDDAALDTLMQTSQIGFVSVKHFEWEVDRELAGMRSKQNDQNWKSFTEPQSSDERCGTDPEINRTSSYKDWEESYRQFRLMVSNWITSEKAGPTIRTGIEEIIFNMDLPEFERRKRLYIMLSSTLLSWFYPDKDNWDKGSTTFLRKDCRLIESPESCTGSCHWKEEEEEGKCLLHVKETTELSDTPGQRAVSTPELYTKRVIDELVRFPVRRKQLMKGEISSIVAIVEPIRDGDQYIIPESSPTWTNLLRLDWAKVIPEEPQYYEEQSREASENDRKIPEGEMPEPLQAMLGETSLRLRIPPNADQTLLPFTAILGVTMGQLGLEENATRLNKNALIQYVRYTSKPIGMMNLTGEIPDGEKEIMFARPAIGIFHSVTILVFLPGQIGILVEEDGVATVHLSSLPEAINERWRSAGLVQMRLKQASSAAVQPIEIGINPRVVPVPLVVQTVQRRGPRMPPKSSVAASAL
jgi:hypothetical protein